MLPIGLLYDTLLAVHDIHASRQPCGVGIIADALSVQVENTLYSLSSNILFVKVNHGINASGSAIGHAIQIISPTGTRNAYALDVDKDCRLVVRCEDGTVETLSSAEISIRDRDISPTL